MYFENFPALYYTLDNGKTGQLVQDIFKRVAISSELKDASVLYETYDIRDGDTPEILADIFYNDPSLYWIILMTNDILDPRFEWPKEWYRLQKYIDRKYPSNVYLDANVSYKFKLGERVNTPSGSGKIVAKENNILRLIDIDGTFSENDPITGEVSETSAALSPTVAFINTSELTHHYEYAANGIIVDSITYVANDSIVTAVSNREYEIRRNDELRSIKILQPQYINRVIQEFKVAINL